VAASGLDFRIIPAGFNAPPVESLWVERLEFLTGFTKKYNVSKLVYYEIFGDPENAILREKKIKAGSRQKKIDLINSMNKEWSDLYREL
jgi:putative endonuclease